MKGREITIIFCLNTVEMEAVQAASSSLTFHLEKQTSAEHVPGLTSLQNLLGHVLINSGNLSFKYFFLS